MEEVFTIYAIRCKVNGKIYIGKTERGVEFRAAQHFNELTRGHKTRQVVNTDGTKTKVKSDWQLDFDKYGKGEFEVYEIITGLTRKQAVEAETDYIRKYNSDDPEYGYNIGTKKWYRWVANIIKGEPPMSEEVEADDT